MGTGIRSYHGQEKLKRDYKPVGFCIYCGVRDVPLGDEHIVPYGLGGTLILPDASCKSCEKITGGIEQQCLRIMFGDLRATLGIKGRKRKHKDKYKPFPMMIEVEGEHIEFDATIPAERLDVTMMLAFPPPTILQGLPPLAILVQKEDWIWVNAATGKRAREKAQEAHSDAKKLVSRASFNLTIFAKMMGKIGYSFTVAEAGFDRFKPIIARAIVGLEPWFPNYLVGGEPEPVPESEYQTETGLKRMTSSTGQEFLVARIRLFGKLGAPVYYAVVGEL